MAKKQPEERIIRRRVYVFNIRIKSINQVTPESYIKLVKAINDGNVTGRISSDGEMVSRLQFETEIEGQPIIYGKLTRYTSIRSKKWFSRNQMALTTYELPEGLFPNGREADYYFIPLAHRFCVVIKPGITKANVQAYLQSALTQVKDHNDEVEVVVQQSSDGFDAIYNALEVRSIVIEVSYSNNDNTDASAAELDYDLREAGIMDFEISAKADPRGNIDVEKAKVISAALELANKGNGRAEARILDENNKKKTVNTANYPLIVSVQARGEDNLLSAVVTKIMSIFRSNNQEPQGNEPE
jgi:hypothetical protein